MTPGTISPERWRVVEPLLDVLLDADPMHRPALLDELCRRDARLRLELPALVTACEESESLFAEPAVIAYEPLLSLRLPRVIGGRYHIVRELAHGGMGTVYVADDPRHGRKVAIKVLHPRVAQLIGAERFRREIEIAAHLSHPHILPLHDSGEIVTDEGDTVLYYVTPFIVGESLRERLRREPPLPTAEALRLGGEIANALDYAHREGVVHLDIKPENVLLQDGHAIVADFGIARAMSTSGEAPPPDGEPMLGTPIYMSPEQRRGDATIDGRSDIYSLGCVIYEMITGTRPPLDRARLIEHGSRGVVRVVERATAEARELRFENGASLATALATIEQYSRRAVRRRMVAGLATLLVGGAAAVMIARTRTSFDPDLIAVAPFAVTDPSLHLWKDGLVDVLSRNLDGAGPLRAVAPTVAIRDWSGHADRESARAFGARTGAGFVVYGQLLAAGDSVRLAATLLDTRTGRSLAEVERRDTVGRVDRLTDSLTIALLRELGRSRNLVVGRATAEPTASFAALKNYLQGEQYYRAAQWDSARVYFEQAVALDSTFALAYRRLAAVRRWSDTRAIPDSTTFALMQRASSFAKGLAPRERVLVEADSLYAAAFFAWRRGLSNGAEYRTEQQLVERLVARLGDAILRYGNDPELWFLLAETRARFDRDVVPGEVDDRAVLELYDRAIAADSSFAPAYVAAAGLAAYGAGPAEAMRYVRAYLSRPRGDGRWSQILRLDAALLDARQVHSLDVVRLADTLSAASMCQVATLVRRADGEADVTLDLARGLDARMQRSPSPDHTLDCALPPIIDALMFRGHFRDADRLASRGAHWVRPIVTAHLADYGIISRDSARAALRPLLPTLHRGSIVQLLPWWAADGDTAAVATHVRAYDALRMDNRPRDRSTEASLRANAASSHAYLALARGDTSAALRQLMTTTDTLHACWYYNRRTIANLLIARRRFADAAERLGRRWPGTTACGDGVADVEWSFARGRVLEQLGRRRDAIASYELVVRAWRTADPELQPVVTQARAALARLR